jgi:arylsulfatase
MPVDRPNILWICTDQQRWDTLGCYGNSLVHSPWIDALARGGALFESAYCQSPVCTPSRASFLTGRYPRTTRCRDNGQNIPADEVLVTRLLADAGYVGGLSGKLHLSASHPSVRISPERRTDDGYDRFHWSHSPDHQSPANEYLLWLRERGVRFERKSHPASPYVHASLPAEYHQTTWCAQKAIDFMKERAAADGKQPWFFSVNLYAPHHPFDPAPEYLERYLDRLDAIPLPDYAPGELDGKPEAQRIDHRGAYGIPNYYPFHEMNDNDHRLVRAAYWAMCEQIDDQVGRMMETLERSGQREHTLIVFMSDHGEMLGDHGIYLKGPYFYEPAVHVPLIIAGSGVAARRISGLVELVDVAPTLLEAAGLPKHQGMQGRSLWPLLDGATTGGEEPPQREDVYCEISASRGGQQWCATMVRGKRYKIVVHHGFELGELYDLTADPNETCNRWRDPAYASIRSELLQRACDRIAATADPLPPRIAPW